MKKYIFFRVLRALLSIVIVTTIVYALVFSLIPRRQIFVSDEQYARVAGKADARREYENAVFERQEGSCLLPPCVLRGFRFSRAAA